MSSPAASPRVGPPMIAVPVVAVPCFLAPAAILETSNFSGQFAMTHQAVLATVTAQAQAQMQLQASNSSSKALTNYGALTSSMLSICPTPLQQWPLPLYESNISTPESVQSTPSTPTVTKTNSIDGYNWRKYGQKQVKSKDRSRSYYKCTDMNCAAKKNVEHDLEGREIEIIYRGQHNHDRPQKARSSKERGAASTGETATLDISSVETPRNIQPGGLPSEIENLNVPSSEIDILEESSSKKEQNFGNETSEQQLFCSSDCEGDAATKTEAEHGDEPDPKRRLSVCTAPSSQPVLKTVKEPKIVVQSPCDPASATDGYKWRKYGQKFVKGNPNPRSYYRCTHNGCPVRKHVEKASDNDKAVLITYEGKHNHNQPSLRNEQANISNSSVSDKTLNDGQVASSKNLESTQILLKIGLNSSSGEEATMKSSAEINHPILDESCVAVPVQNS